MSDESIWRTRVPSAAMPEYAGEPVRRKDREPYGREDGAMPPRPGPLRVPPASARRWVLRVGREGGRLAMTAPASEEAVRIPSPVTRGYLEACGLLDKEVD